MHFAGHVKISPSLANDRGEGSGHRDSTRYCCSFLLEGDFAHVQPTRSDQANLIILVQALSRNASAIFPYCEIRLEMFSVFLHINAYEHFK